MGEYLKDICWRAVSKTLGSYGHNWETLSVSVVAFILPASLYWCITRYNSGGWRAIVSLPVGWETTLKDIALSAGTGFLVLGVVFLVNVVRAAHDRDRESRDQLGVSPISIEFQAETFPFVQPIGRDCVLYRVAVRSNNTIRGIRLVVSQIEPRTNNFAGIEISLIQMHDREHRNPGARWKERFDLFPDQPRYIDVVQKEDASSHFRIQHIMQNDVDSAVLAGDYTVTLAIRDAPTAVSREFSLLVDARGRLQFRPIN
ncbi:MAG: hypothetical protein A3H28_02725 [Acidobacteria bacterium RIFCSPLOWO2_02_FULL_61_28]|nr:MAG: hypothetical protein A3H28_02725 [Acidobacteria bacterium RIFCSPLOWO2_02_FULL_61_28]